MGSVRKNDILSFQLKLLSNLQGLEQYSFTKLIIEKQLTQEEYEGIMSLLQILDGKYKSQKEEGLLNFTSLLLHFVGMLNHKLQPDEALKALQKEGFYPPLVDELIKLEKSNNF